MTTSSPGTTTAPVRAATGPRAVRGSLLAAGAAGAGVLLLLVRDPHVLGSYGICPLRLLTGWSCPACGALRATADLAHLDLAAAWSSNPLWVALIPVVVVVWAVRLTRQWRGRPTGPLPTWLAWSGLTLVVVFGVLRNLPVPALTWMLP